MADVNYITRISGSVAFNIELENEVDFDYVALFHRHYETIASFGISVAGDGEVGATINHYAQLWTDDTKPKNARNKIYEKWNPGYSTTPPDKGLGDGDFAINFERLEGGPSTPYKYKRTIVTPEGTKIDTFEQSEGYTTYNDPGPQRISVNASKNTAPYLTEHKVYSAYGVLNRFVARVKDAEQHGGLVHPFVDIGNILVEWSNGETYYFDELDELVTSEYDIYGPDGTFEYFDDITYYDFTPDHYSGYKARIYAVKLLWIRYMNSLYDFVADSTEEHVRNLIEEKGYTSGFDDFADFDETNYYYHEYHRQYIGRYEIGDFKTTGDFEQDHVAEINNFNENASHVRVGDWLGIASNQTGSFSIDTPREGFVARISDDFMEMIDMYVDTQGIPWIAWVSSTKRYIYLSHKDRNEKYAYAQTVVDANNYTEINDILSVTVGGDGSRIYVAALCSGDFDDDSDYRVYEWESDSQGYDEWSAPRQVDVYPE